MYSTALANWAKLWLREPALFLIFLMHDLILKEKYVEYYNSEDEFKYTTLKSTSYFIIRHFTSMSDDIFKDEACQIFM